MRRTKERSNQLAARGESRVARQCARSRSSDSRHGLLGLRASANLPRTLLTFALLGCGLARAGAAQGTDAGRGAPAGERDARGAVESKAQALERELAEALLRFEVERDFAAAEARLEELAVQAADPRGFEGQGRVLASVAVARVQLVAQLGAPAQALAALEVLPARAEQPPAGSPLARAVEIAEGDARLAALRAQLAPQDGAQDGGGDPVVGQVRRLLELGQAVYLREPSRAQVRALEHLVREARQGTGTLGAPALKLLLDNAPLETAAFLLGEVGGAGEAFHRLVLRELAERQVLSGSGTWSCRNGEPPVLLEPVWRELLERLIVHSGSLRTALPLIAGLARRDALTPPLVEALRGALFSAQPDLVKEAFLAIADLPGVVSVHALYEALLEHPEAALRLSAARVLANYQEMGHLLDVVDSEDVALRTELARALGRKSLVTTYFASNCNLGLGSQDVRAEDPRERPAIVRLCADPDPGVRSLAVAAAVRRKVELPRGVLLELAGLPDSEQLEDTSELTVADPRLLGEFLLRLAPSPRPTVAEAVASRLAGHDWTADPEVLQPALRALIERSPLEPDRRRVTLEVALKNVWSSPSVTAEVARWALERDDRDLIALSLEAASGRNSAGFSELSTAQAVELVARYVRAVPGAEGQMRRLPLAVAGLAQRRAARSLYHEVAGLRGLDLRLRLDFVIRGLRTPQAGADPVPDALVAVRDVLADPRWFDPALRDTPQVRGALDKLDDLAQAAGGETWNRFLAAALADADFPSDHLSRLVGLYEPLAPGGQELARSILERWPVDGEPFHLALAKTLRQGQELGLEPHWLVRGLERYPIPVTDAMGRWRDPAFLAPLTRALEPDWMPHGADRRRVRESAARGLANLLSDDAARALLACAERTGDEELRKLCFEGLETIRTYQEARERWERRVSEREARAQAAERLMGLLEGRDSSLRAAALVALGELGEVRALPRIAELAVDADPAVRAAALEALRRLRPTAGDGAPAAEKAD